MYGLIGYPIGHSFSADFFNNKFKNEGIDESYRLFPLPDISKFPEFIDSHKDLHGLNVTIPHKQTVIPYLNSLSEDARDIGAVNVIKISDNKKNLTGFNTDAIGFHDTIVPLIKPYMTHALVLGTGGASKAVIYVLKKLGLKVTVVSRQRSESTVVYEDLTPEIMEQNTVIVNTTPLGMWPNIENAPDIPYQLLTSQHLCYDLVYNPEMTEFMKRASQNGASVKNGLDMLHGQAIAAWKIWNS